MIEISHVSKSYGSGSKAIRDLSLTIDDGNLCLSQAAAVPKEYIDQAPDEGA